MAWAPKESIVVPIDFSDESFAAVDTALEIAKDASCVHLVHVLPEMSTADPGVVWQTINDENRGQHAEERLRERLTDPKYSEVQVEIEFGDPGFRIADLAQRIGAELIVIPSHGRTGLNRLLIGSVAERVVRLSHCPVLIMRQ